MESKQTTSRILFLTIILMSIGASAYAQYRGVDVPAAYVAKGPEQPGYGPSALRIAPNGTFWVVNPADNSLTAVDQYGGITRQFELDAVGITDVQFTEDGELLVLDSSAEEPAVLSVTPDGTLRDRRPLRRIQSMHSDASTQPVAMTRAQALVHDWSRNTIAAGPWRIRPGSDASPNAVLEGRGVSIEITANHGVIRGIRIVSDSSSGVYVLAEEVTDGDTIMVDATVRRFSKEGELLGIGRIPLSEQYTFVEEPVAVAGDGTVYMLSTRPGVAAISVLTMAHSIPEILPERRTHRRDLGVDATPVNDAATPPISRAQMEANARSYINNAVFHPQNALTGYCAGRTKPRHLGTTPRTISSVAYKWGGWDSIADYNRAIANGSPAGDIDTTVQSCSRGVDCSGFVGRVWGLTDFKRGTCMFGDVADQISIESLLKGDILTKCDDHVVMFESRSGASGIFAYESTVNNAVDRVVYAYSSWARLNGYKPMRYRNIVGDVSVPSHVASSYSPSSVTLNAVATFQSTWKNSDSTPMRAILSVRMPWGATSDYIMNFISGTTVNGALFEARLGLQSAGRYDYAVTVLSLSTGRTSRYPQSGFTPGPTAMNTPVTYNVNPWNSPVCGQYPVTIRVQSYVIVQNVVRFTVTKGSNWCGWNGNFIANGVIDVRADGPYGPIVGSASYGAGVSQVMVDVGMNLARGSRRNFYATVRNQGFWAGPIAVSAQ